MNHRPFANYDSECSIFTDVVSSDREPNILLFQGESGTGKSHLIDYCVQSVPAMPSVLLKLQSGSETIPMMLTRMGAERGWHYVPNFTRTAAALLEQPGKEADSVWQMGMHRHLNEIGQISDTAARLTRYRLLTDAWFADALTLEQPFLLALDSYESSSTLFDQWFREDFLAGAANSPRMRVLVGGQKVPEMHEAWSFCASLRELTGVLEAQAWMEWAAQEGYQIPSLEILTGVVIALKGNPSQIVQVIQTQFPQTNTGVAPKDSVREQRKRLRENITTAFSLSELKDICYDMEIGYENLPGHDHINGFVRELLAYAGRIGRLQELIQVCRTARPHLAW